MSKMKSSYPKPKVAETVAAPSAIRERPPRGPQRIRPAAGGNLLSILPPHEASARKPAPQSKPAFDVFMEQGSICADFRAFSAAVEMFATAYEAASTPAQRHQAKSLIARQHRLAGDSFMNKELFDAAAACFGRAERAYREIGDISSSMACGNAAWWAKELKHRPHPY
ncbi:MAG: hypothetical protein KGH63_04245 [Candidatus Micrarchaeota archaeon]|nr:hypothetical protein [Candidatus Micrarchaeota archaeon]